MIVKRVGYILLIAGIVVLAVVCIAGGQAGVSFVKRLFHKVMIWWRQDEIDKLRDDRKGLDKTLDQNDETVQELETRIAEKEAQLEYSKLAVEGMNHEAIVTDLRNRGY